MTRSKSNPPAREVAPLSRGLIDRWALAVHRGQICNCVIYRRMQRRTRLIRTRWSRI